MSSLIRFFILLFLGFVGLMLIVSAFAHGAADPVTPDTYVPPTLQVVVTINEDQEASNGKYGSSTVTLQFMTNEIIPSEFVTFGNQEYVVCNGITLNLGSFGSSVTTYSVHMLIPNNPPEYTCTYHYPLQGKPSSTTIFKVPVLTQLNPKLQRAVPSSSDISVSYNPDKNLPDCQVQVTANSPSGTATGNSVQEDGSIYTGPNVSSLSGLGNLVMTRTCVPPQDQFDHQNKADDGCQCNGSPLTFDKLNLTYKSTASIEVSWVPPDAPATTAS